MKDQKQKMVNFLLLHANPSIKLRVRKEVLNDISESEEKEWKLQISNERTIRFIAEKQQPNGWIGLGFHGGSKNAGQFDNQEVGVKYLAEKAVGKDNPVLKRAIEAFVTTPFDDLCYGTKGNIYNEFEYAAFGMNLINCACIARAGFDDVIDITPQIQLSLDSFRRVLEIDSVLDITRPICNGKIRVFNDREKWPCRYHLDILSHTDSWKNESNIKMLAESMNKLMKIEHDGLAGYVPAVWVGHPVGPLGGFPAEGLSVKTSALLPSPIACGKPDFYNFEYIEWFARCGIMAYIPDLWETVRNITRSIDENGICHAPVLESALKSWGAYSGQRLEADWKSPIRKLCDITFRALLILHYSNYSEG